MSLNYLVEKLFILSFIWH